MNDRIRESIELAALDGQKMAMFHFQVLINAHALQGTDPNEFCRLVNVPATYATEFRKMLSLARLMNEQGASLITRS